MTTEPTIPAAIIEKAARAQYEYERSDPDWEREGAAYKQLYRDGVIAALIAVYVDIQAEALRGAAASPIPREALGGKTRDWLRTRADELDGGKP